MQATNCEPAVTATAQFVSGHGLSTEERSILAYMGLAVNAFWQPSQIAPALGLSVIQVRSQLRALELAGYVDRARATQGPETEFRLTDVDETTRFPLP